MAITLSHGGPTIYSSPSRSEQVLVGTMRGVVTLQRKADGSEWQVADRALEDNHVHALLIEPESGLIFAGAGRFQQEIQRVPEDTLYVSADGGVTWERRDNGLTQDNVYSLAAVRLGVRTRIYLGTEPAHLFYSDDLGLNWTELPSLRSAPSLPNWRYTTIEGGHLKHINFDPDHPRIVFTGIEQGGLFKSTDAGETWEDLAVPHNDVHRTVIHPTNPKRMYVTGGMGMWVTSDGGANWEQWTNPESEIGGYPDQLVYLPRNPDLMFIASSHTGPRSWRETHFAGSRISQSQDGGRTWDMLRDGLPDRLQANVEAMCLEDWGDGFSLFAGTTAGEVLCSDQEGKNWSVIASGLAPISKSGHFRNLVPTA